MSGAQQRQGEVQTQAQALDGLLRCSRLSVSPRDHLDDDQDE